MGGGTVSDQPHLPLEWCKEVLPCMTTHPIVTHCCRLPASVPWQTCTTRWDSSARLPSSGVWQPCDAWRPRTSSLTGASVTACCCRPLMATRSAWTLWSSGKVRLCSVCSQKQYCNAACNTWAFSVCAVLYRTGSLMLMNLVYTVTNTQAKIFLPTVYMI